MRERPMLVTGQLVPRVLDGSKTQTRRLQGLEIANAMPGLYQVPPVMLVINGHVHANWDWDDEGVDRCDLYKCPYGQPGDRLWVRETHRPIWGQTQGYLIGVDYRADPAEKWTRLGDQIGTPTKWTPSIHMRREYSRILLEIVSIRCERLKDISEEDARAEGIIDGGCLSCGEPEPCGCASPAPDARDAFIRLWESINGAGSWAENPWVWRVEFKRVTP